METKFKKLLIVIGVVLFYTTTHAQNIYQFAASSGNSGVLLSWNTTNESNINYFGIERSKDGNKWEQIDKVKGKNNSNQVINYQYTDSLPLAGAQYYRLKQTDLNGNFTYSTIVYADFVSANSVEVLIFPM